MTGGCPHAAVSGHRHQQPAAGHLGCASAGLVLRGVVFWTATTATTATPLISLGFSVRSLPAVSATTEGKSFRVSPRACGRSLLWCLAPVNEGICSAVIAPARHRPPAARHRLTLAR